MEKATVAVKTECAVHAYETVSNAKFSKSVFRFSSFEISIFGPRRFEVKKTLWAPTHKRSFLGLYDFKSPWLKIAKSLKSEISRFRNFDLPQDRILTTHYVALKYGFFDFATCGLSKFWVFGPRSFEVEKTL